MAILCPSKKKKSWVSTEIGGETCNAFKHRNVIDSSKAEINLDHMIVPPSPFYAHNKYPRLVTALHFFY